MNKRLAWSQIRDFFSGHWIELVEVEWSSDSTFPLRAKVRNFDPQRSRLLDMIEESGEQSDSVILYLGKVNSFIEHDAQVATL